MVGWRRDTDPAAQRKGPATMHENQLSLDEEDAASLIAERFPEYRDHVVRRLETSGTVNAIFRVGEEATARFPLLSHDSPGPDPRPSREVSAMEEFLQASPFPGPRPLGTAEPSALCPGGWSLQTWLSGAIPTPHSHESSDGFADDLSDLIAALRRYPTGERTFTGTGRGGILQEHDGWVEECLERSDGLLEVGPLRKLWEHFRTLEPAGADVMNHGDLIPANLLVDGERLSGVLDTGGFGPADPALDLVAAWHLLDDARRRRLRERLGVDEDEWDRGAGWAFEQAIGLVWYYRVSNPVMAELGRSTLDRLLGAGWV